MQKSPGTGAGLHMSKENVALIRGVYDAFAAGNVPGVLGAMSPDIVWNEGENFPYADGNPYRGPEAVFARCVGEWEGFAVEMNEILDAGDTIVALGRYAAAYKTTGKPTYTQAVHVWRIKNGKIVSFQQFADLLKFLRSGIEPFADGRRSSHLVVSCPVCGRGVAWPAQACADGHSIDNIEGVPIVVAKPAEKNTADPSYSLEHAVDIARGLAQTDSLSAAIEKFFSLREQELGAPLAREKALFQQRDVPAFSEAVTDACQVMGSAVRMFPGPERTHIEIGCGLGFDLAASSRSYFGPNVLGIDLSPHYLVMAQKLFAEHGLRNVRLVCADIADGWPIPLDQYDVGFISLEGVLEHIKDVDGFFEKIKRIRSYPYVVYLTVPYRWTLHPESHFQLRGVGWLPTRKLQDDYVMARLGVTALDHVEQYSGRSLRKTLAKHFKPGSITVVRNSNNPFNARYLRAVVHVGSARDLVFSRPA